MKNTFVIQIILCFMFISNAQTEYPKNFFSSPIDIKIAVAGTFGELRTNHFHSGIDIKTKQKKNIPKIKSKLFFSGPLFAYRGPLKGPFGGG